MSLAQSPPGTSKNVVLAVTTLGSFSTPLIMSSLNVALPTIGQEFALGAVALGSLATVYLVVTAALLVPVGKIADIVGRKRVFLYGAGVLSVACVLSGTAQSFPWLVASLLLQGLGGAMIFSTGPAILTAVFPPGERGRALGINVAAVYLGLSLGPAIGGVLTGVLGWRSVFVLPALIGIAVIGFVVTRVHDEWVVPRVARFDIAGSVIYGLALVALTVGFSTLPGARGAALALGGLLALAVFIWWELRAADPILNIDLFRRNRVFAFSNLAALISYSATFAVGFLLSLYLQYIKGFAVETAGFILMAQPVMQTVFSPLAGRLSDKVESQVVASVGMAFTAAGLLLLSFLGESTSVIFLVLTLALLGFGFALFSSPNTNSVLSSVDGRFLGVASATLGTMRLLGQMLSMAIALLVFSVTLGSARVTEAVHGEFATAVRIAFIIFTVLCVIGVAASLARGHSRNIDGRAPEEA